MVQQARLLPLLWLALAVVILAADYAAGPFVRFRNLFFLPVILAAWFNSCWGMGLAFVLPLAKFAYVTSYDEVPWTLVDLGVNSAIQATGLAVLAFFVQRTAQQRRHIAVLQGFLPICCFCKRIRDAEDCWQPLEKFISERSEAHFTHGFCPECALRHYGEYLNPVAAGKESS